LFPSIKEALQAYSGGFHFRHLNLGNIPIGAGKRRLGKSLFLSMKELRVIRGLEESGVSISYGLEGCSESREELGA
jgi:mannose/fructose/N-acetylgalactosamine-specific phosphotransferase system component IIB